MSAPKHQTIHRPVITGMGAVTPCGESLDQIWDNISHGRTAVRSLNLDPVGAIPAAVIGDKHVHEPGRSIRLAIDAAGKALEHSRAIAHDISSYLSSSKGDVMALEQAYAALHQHGPRSIPGHFLNRYITCSPSRLIAKKFRLGGRCMNFPTACATGLVSLTAAAQHISSGRERAVLAGAAEASITPLIVAGFSKMGVLADPNQPPQTAMRPFDRTRTGFVLGEGAAALLIESIESATARSAPIHAEIAGWAVGCDWRNMIGLGKDYTIAAAVIRQAVEKAGIDPLDIDYINLHGTATRLNDPFEARLIRNALGSAAANIPASSTKPFTGHLLGASGAVETAITVLAMQNSFIPPTLNLSQPDPDCPLRHVASPGMRKKLAHALVINYGFAGHLAALILRNPA